MVQHLSHWVRSVQHWFMVIVLAIVPLIGFSSSPVQAKAAVHDQAPTITIDGVLQAIDEGIWTVSGVSIRVNAQTTISGAPTIGSTVHIVAVSDSENKLTALSISIIPVTATVITETPGPSPTPTNTATPSITPTASMTNTPGPSPTPSITPTGTLSASPTGIPYVTIIIEGPVQEITVNVIVIYGQKIKLRGDDPVLVKLKVGDWVKISGNHGFDDDNVTVIIIAVIVVVIDTPPVIIVGPSNNGNGNGQGGGDDDEDGHKPKKDK